MRTRWILGAALVAAMLGLGAVEARAQDACADPEQVHDGIFLFYDNQLEALPLLGPDACSKLTKGAVATCHKTVASMLKCYQTMYRSTYKAQQIACGATEDPKQCSADHKGMLALILQLIKDASGDMHAECDGPFAEAIYFSCLAL